MKLRIRGDTIRLRLKRSEVDTLASGGHLIEETHFPGATLSCRLETSEDGAFAASFRDNTLSVRVPAADMLTWATTDRVSMFAEQGLGAAGTLSLLVEKDFECLSPGHHRADEDDADTYPHPEADAGRGCAR